MSSQLRSLQQLPVADPARDQTLRALMNRAAAGRFPAADFTSSHLPSPTSPADGVFGFFGHHVIASDVDPDWVKSWTERSPFALSDVRFLAALADRLGVDPGIYDALFAAPGKGEPPEGHGLVLSPEHDHPRVHRALAYRDPSTVVAYRPKEGGGVLVLGRGLAGRMEAAFEVYEGRRGHGLGRRLVSAARAIAPADEPVFIQVSPGNVWSMRATLSDTGWRAVGSEILFHRSPDPHRLP